MSRAPRFTLSAEAAPRQLEGDAVCADLLKQVRKTLGLLETDLRHLSLRTQEFRSLGGPSGERVFEACVQNRTPAAWRVFFVGGPYRIEKGRRAAVHTTVAPTLHP